MLKIGLTGGIGSGKSEVSKFFQAWGAYIFDADKEAKHIINTDKIMLKLKAYAITTPSKAE